MQARLTAWRAALSPDAVGVFLVILGLGALTAQDVVMKELTARYSAFQLLGIRTCFALLVLIAAVTALRVPAPLRTAKLGLQLARGASLFGALACFYTAMVVMPMVDVIAVFFAAPVLAVALAAVWLGDRVGPGGWVAVAVGFAGSLIMVKPTGAVADAASWVALGAALFYAVSLVLSRMLGRTEAAFTTALYSLLCYLVLGFAGVGVLELLLAGGPAAVEADLLKPWAAPRLEDLGGLAMCGVGVAVGFYCLAKAYELAPVSVLAPFEYSGLLWGGVLAYVAWAELPSASSLAGAALITAAGIYVARRRLA